MPLQKSSPPGIAQPSGPLIYYKDPSGRPSYSQTPRNTDDGKPYIAVLASEDVSVDPKPPAEAQAGKKIIYYRNPMGPRREEMVFRANSWPANLRKRVRRIIDRPGIYDSEWRSDRGIGWAVSEVRRQMNHGEIPVYASL